MIKAVEYQLEIKRSSCENGVQIRSAVVDGAARKAVKILAEEGLVIIHWEENNKVCYSNK